MIKANELRLGNYFHPNSISNGIRIPSTAIWYKVGAINNFGEIEVNDPHRKETLVFSTKEIDPIPLTPEILEKSGFKNQYEHYWIKDKELLLTLDKFWWWTNYWTPDDEFGIEALVPYKEISYVHQLQNLYFSLTGQELSIKEPSKTIPA